MESLDGQRIRAAVLQALEEDLGAGDVTSLACLPPEAKSTAVMRARERLTVAGLDFAEEAFREMAPNAVIRRHVVDGAECPAGTVLMEVSGPSRALLSAERVALNFVQRLSGVATATARHVAVVAGTGTRILDTRKTTPGWRLFEKYAVRCGGGLNHRMGLHDRILIKDNHLAALADAPPDPVTAAVRRAREQFPGLFVQVEADTPEQARQAADAGADGVLLDNMPPERLREALAGIAGRCQTEASGGISGATIRAVAATGVQFISVGAITHSARAVDIGLDFLP
ncbi:MAG: carboxylating nicotinate-nucleotide diphosphorylase [Verrucomicrobia bacterium]|nr:carboxylating nicotinate-nucleotide diphosphorylase [Verrucomicrobiota bacterium]